ncbi:hypothetical protein CHS0354_021163 [Potamilus streckersoni]|uniref:chitin synthase n=1 Tax=Potamilus streckersoni TaxID=2493646 RepID=A0AAE0W6U4_9BIVA|nr:hypothetical protein CHS0354_021163 [Potamilus streckersoni]
MDEADGKQTTGEKDERKVQFKERRPRKRGSSDRPNDNKSKEKADRRPGLVEDGRISSITNTEKRKSSKTSKNDKGMRDSPDSRDEDENNVGGKQEKEKKAKQKRKSKKKYYEGETAKQKSREHLWDFMMAPRDEDRLESDSDQNWGTLEMIVKIIVCIVISTVVLGTAVISKLCLVLITSNILPPMNDNDTYWWHKTAGLSLTYTYHETNVQWIWALMLIISAPYIFTIMASLWQLLLGRKKWESSWKVFPQIMIQETIHSIGLCMMAFILLPSIDPIAGILVCFHVATIPGFLGIFQSFSDESHPRLWRILRAIAVVLQLAAIGFACVYYILETKNETRILQIITICSSPIFISISWWENYLAFDKVKNGNEVFDKENNEKEPERVPQHDSHENTNNSQSSAEKKVNSFGCLWDLLRLRSERKVMVDILVNVWKVIITLFVPICLFGLPCPNISECMDTLFRSNLNSAFANGVGKSELSSMAFKNCNNHLPLIVAAVGILCSGACYRAVKLGCQIVAQIPCVSIPLTFSSPLALAVLFWILNRNIESCALSYPKMIQDPNRLLNHLQSSYYWMVIVSGICGYISLVIIRWHIWRPDKKRLRKSNELFAKPLYCGILFDQSITLNIIRKVTDKKHDGKTDNSQKIKTSIKPSSTPKVYLCATMWHETKSEMTKLIRSILRLGEDRKKISTMKDKMDFFSEDFFNFEVHIFFDDAFVTQKDAEGKEEIVLNRYVKDLIEVVREVTENEAVLECKCSTKYGGRLQWTLPFECVMFAHLKHKNLIRRKKRWSQVMYMYFFLGYKFLKKVKTAKPDLNNIDDILTAITEQRALREKIENTFILALDGDVDFQPEAVKYLLDRMRKNKGVGAACGRIHPTGNGPVVWYQKFEYAVSHWLQKVAEDMLGCVLCSPGCFSLFRGSALIDSNVMKIYTTYPTESWHHVQYDQGEDRWLCTLLLKQGYKIEYVAASDAFTEAPEGFNEFFNQRRRWSPSTMANILDLILDWKHVVKINTNISRMYIFYQTFLLFTSILTPGTILLMIVGALTMAFKALPLWVALLVTILPLAAFIAICFNARTKTQLKFAVILSIAYALVMMIVLVGLVVHMVQNGLCSITTIFFIYVAGVFLISALLHPKEFFCVIHGFLYFIAVPCTSLIMMLYALCNLNITSWGTRETTPQQDTNQRIPHERSQWLDSSQETGSIFRCLCCSQESNQQLLSDKLDTVQKQLANNTNEKCEQCGKARLKEAAIQTDNALQTANAIEGRADVTNDSDKEREEPVTQMIHSVSNGKDSLEAKHEEDENPINDDDTDEPYTNKAWTHDRLLKKIKYKGLNRTEKEFWKNMIRRYLFPEDQTDEKKKQTEHDLTILRNKVCLFFILANTLFITIIFALQQIAAESGSLSVHLPCITGESGTNNVEPISFAFTFIFGIILLLQFICMLLHRLSTLIHICSRTEIFKKTNAKRNMWELYADINRAVNTKRKEKREYLQRIFQANAVHPVAESESSSEITAKMRFKEAGTKIIIEHRNKKDEAIDMFREQIEKVNKYIKKLQNEMRNGGDMKKELRKIRKKFPTFTKEAHHAILQIVASRSHNSEADRGNLQNGQLSSELV